MNDASQMVFLIDDEPSVLKALARVIGATGFRTASFSSPQSFLEQYEPAARGCIVLDVSMPGFTGLELQQALIEKNCSLPIVFLTARGDIPTSVRAMKHGAVDFLTKPVDDNDLIAAVDRALAREATDHVRRAQITELQMRFSTLTSREQEVLGHVIAGRLNKQIAAVLGTTEKTVKVHRARVMEKMQAQSLAELVRLSGTAGISPTP
jgi:FixJ family two-component response regulator